MACGFSLPHLEPPPRLYALLGRASALRHIHCRFAADLAFLLPRQAGLLDVGTGPGFLLRHLLEMRADLKLTGLDLSRGMLAYARRNLARLPGGARVPLVQADARALPFPAAAFEAVLATFSLHIWPDPARGVAELARVLRPGGRGFVYELNREAPWSHRRAFAQEAGLPAWLVHLAFRVLSPQHALSLTEFRRILAQAGLKRWRLTPVHHLFWRLEMAGENGQPEAVPFSPEAG